MTQTARQPADAGGDEQFRIMADASPVMIWVTDTAGGIRFINRAYREYFGVIEEDVRGHQWGLLVHPEDSAAYVGVFMASLHARRHFTGQCRVRHADGTWHWIASYAAPYFSPAGAYLGMVGSSPDITDQVVAEQALRESEQRFRNMADHAPVMIWVTEPDQRVSFVNAVWREFTGYESDGADWLAAVHPEDRPAVEAEWLAANRSRSPVRAEYRMRRHDGVYRWVITAAAPRFDAAREFRGFTGSIMDITDRKRAEQALKEADQRKDVFLAVLSHELRNPLAPIRNAATLLCEKLPRSGDLSAACAIINRQTAALTHLVDDLLDVARLTRGKMQLRPSRMALHDAIESALESIRPYIDAQGHELVVSEPPEPVYILGDTTRIAQVILNLLHNAAKYTRRGGHIALTVTCDEREARLSVRDDGIGIAADMFDRVFDMFSQADAEAVKAHEGLGIGLALVKGVIALHGGRVEVRSAGMGRGSEFIVYLPRSLEEAPRDASAQVAQATSIQRRRILVVDDNEDSAQSLAMLLRHLGHDVTVAYSGESALELAVACRPAIVLLDIGMPGMNGYEVARRLSAQRHGRSPLLVALTGWGQDEDRRRAAAAGFDRHMTKPVDIRELQRIIVEIPAAAAPET